MNPRIAISALFALDGALIGGWLAHLPDVQAQYGLSKGQLGSILLFSSVGAISAMFFSGTLIHRFGNRRVSVAFFALVLLVAPFLLRAPSPAWLGLGLVLLGATNGTVDIAMNDHAVAVAARADRPILSSVHGWWCVGGFLGGAGTALANRLGLAPATHMAAASVAMGALLLASASGLLPDKAPAEEGGAKFALPRGPLLGLGLLTLLALFAEGALLDWSAVYFRDELRTSAATAALALSAGSAAMAAGRLLGDRVVARLGGVRTLQVSGLLTGAGLLIAAACGPAGAFLGLAVAGLGLANAVPVLFAAAAEVPGVSSGAGIAAVASLGYAAFLGGPPLVGHLAEATSLRVGLAAVGVLALAIAAFGRRALEGRGKR